MPTVPVLRDLLHEGLEEVLTQEQFEDLCFDFGVELDDVTSEREMVAKEQGEGAAQGHDDRVIYKIDVPANRYDLLCLEGIVRAMRVFRGQQTPPAFRLTEPAQRQTLTVEADTARIRPHVVSCILRGVTFTETSKKSFVDLQDRLHQGLCLKRRLVAIGTHDLDTLQGPFRYRALPPEDISFVPLSQTREFNARELMEFYKTDPSVKHIKPYVGIIEESPVYPVIYDANGTVCSLPPIINGEHSKITLETRNVFIECTATDLTKANAVLNTVVAMFSEYCDEPFTVEPVDVVYEDGGRVETYPQIAETQMDATVAEICSLVGVQMEPPQICELLNRMMLPAEHVGDSVRVTIPITRSDVLHPVDICEDVAIAFGYNNIERTVPATNHVGRAQPINQLSAQLRDAVAMAGFTECLTLGLCSMDENFAFLKHANDGSAVELSNPVTIEFDVVRTTLLPGVLKTLACNKNLPVRDGIRLFEISDVVKMCEGDAVGARNYRHFCALYGGPTAGFELVHGLVDRVMQLLRVIPDERYAASAISDNDRELACGSYYIRASEDPMYFQGRGAEVVLVRDGAEAVVGSLGVLHPDVIASFQLHVPCSVVELQLEVLAGTEREIDL